MNELHKFNTGRMYTKDGQNISWAILEDDGMTFVAFIDHSRSIEAVIPVFFGNLEFVTNEWVLRAYDMLMYTHNGKLIRKLKEMIANEL